jgi:hypothetical protein
MIALVVATAALALCSVVATPAGADTTSLSGGAAAGQFSIHLQVYPDQTGSWGPSTFEGSFGSLAVQGASATHVDGSGYNGTVVGSQSARTADFSIAPFTLSSADGVVSGMCSGTQALRGIGAQLSCQIGIGNSPPLPIELHLAFTNVDNSNAKFTGNYTYSGVFVGEPVGSSLPIPQT